MDHAYDIAKALHADGMQECSCGFWAPTLDAMKRHIANPDAEPAPTKVRERLSMVESVVRAIPPGAKIPGIHRVAWVPQGEVLTEKRELVMAEESEQIRFKIEDGRVWEALRLPTQRWGPWMRTRYHKISNAQRAMA